MSERALRVEGLEKSFNGTVANDGIDLTIEAGEFHGIIGPNGSGKTTLFNVITGFLEPDAGAVFFEGEEITGLPPDAIARRGLVRTFQITSGFENLTVRENLLSAYAGGLSNGFRVPDDQRQRAAELLELLELEAVADHEASDLSGGQQKLLELGRVMMREPDCLLLDEPTASVNPALQQRLLAFLRRINDEGTTVLLIEHDMNVVAEMIDRLSVLNRGRVITQGSFDEVTSDVTVRDAYLGTAREATVDPENKQSAASSGTAGVGHEPASVAESADPDRNRGRQPDDHGEKSRDGGSERSKDEGGEGYLQARNLVTGYGTHTVVDGVSVQSRDGVTCIFGPNGSGKSTLLKALAGVVPVWSGEIELDGQSMTGRQSHEFIEAGITMVPQRDMIFEGLTVKENLQLGGAAVTVERPIEERMADVFEAFPPLEKKLSSRAGSLSGGQQTMLGFGRAMMGGGDVFLLDEPTSSLAPTITDDIFGMIETLVNEDKQVILVEQNVREALPVADHVYILAGGTIRFDGSSEQLRDEDFLMRRFLGIESA